jgi:hypothetical protein
MAGKQRSFTVFTIATGKYIHYFEDLYYDLIGCLDFVDSIDIILLTDQNFIPKEGIAERPIRLRKFYASYEGWIFATLMRYREILRFENELPDQNTIWLDADMRIVNPEIFCREILNIKHLTFSRHPGHVFSFRKHSGESYRIRIFLIASILKRLLTGQFFSGEWEESPQSTAYIPPLKRRRLVHGAVWGGTRRQVIEMCTELNDAVNEDLKRKYVAVWHDESHLNRYFSARKHQYRYFSRYFVGADTLTFTRGRSALWSVDKKKIDLEKDLRTDI